VEEPLQGSWKSHCRGCRRATAGVVEEPLQGSWKDHCRGRGRTTAGGRWEVKMSASSGVASSTIQIGMPQLGLGVRIYTPSVGDSARGQRGQILKVAGVAEGQLQGS